MIGIETKDDFGGVDKSGLEGSPLALYSIGMYIFRFFLPTSKSIHKKNLPLPPPTSFHQHM